MSISRREFLGAAAASTFISFAERKPPAASAGRPTVIASANGIRGVAKAYDMITKENAEQYYFPESPY